ncbi:MAG: polyprenyl synthetase family protein [Ruminococcaceae bacterium]|nr:polyprenyl synthetase family protein [Oscillospiraceae bacterium]
MTSGINKYQKYYLTVEEALNNIFSDLNDESVVTEAMRYSILNGGKRFRGIIALAFCEVISGDYKEAIIPACAVEMVHSYSLIHDDLPIMDDDDFRRGKPSCHVKYGEATALLAGDGLLTLAFEHLSKMPDAQKSIECVGVLASASGHRGMILGQQLDIENENKKSKNINDLLKIYKNKTGKLISAAGCLGLIAGNASAEDRQVSSYYLDNIGLAFQIIDDVLDITSTTETMGKPVGSDIKNDKPTIASVNGIEESIRYSKSLISEAKEKILERFGEKSHTLLFIADKVINRVN